MKVLLLNALMALICVINRVSPEPLPNAKASAEPDHHHLGYHASVQALVAEPSTTVVQQTAEARQGYGEPQCSVVYEYKCRTVVDNDCQTTGASLQHGEGNTLYNQSGAKVF